MIFSFCIDISLLFNFSNNPRIRTGLRALTNIFLKRNIQSSKEGHCSIQDSLATLQLLKLKLEKGIIFGNVILGWNFPVWCKENSVTPLGTHLTETPNEKGEAKPGPSVASTTFVNNFYQVQKSIKKFKKGKKKCDATAAAAAEEKNDEEMFDFK